MKLSPMNRTTSDSFVAPFLIIYSIIFNFCVDKGPEKYWIVINIIFASIIIFCCLVYNEIIVLKCYGLDKNTYAEITERSNYELIKMWISQILVEKIHTIAKDMIIIMIS